MFNFIIYLGDESEKEQKIKDQIASQTEELKRLEATSSKLEMKMIEMNEKKVTIHHQSLDHSNKDHFIDHLDSKLRQVLKRINSIKKLIEAEKDELASENQKEKTGKRAFKNGQTRFHPTEDGLNMIEPQGIFLLPFMNLQNTLVVTKTSN